MPSATPLSMPCRGCGAALAVVPGGDAQLVCGHCGHRQPIAPAAVAPKSDWMQVIAERYAAADRDALMTAACGSCGAETTRAPGVISDACPFCGNPQVAQALSSALRPAAILPFALDEGAARAAMSAWERRLWWKPGRLFSDADLLPLVPVFLPYFNFDWRITTRYQGERGDEANKKTHWTKVSGNVTTIIDDSTVFASRSVPRTCGADLEPFDSDKVLAFNEEYLVGVRAETSALPIGEVGDLAHRIALERVDYDIKCDIGGDQQQVTERDSHFDEIKLRLTLMPIWVTRYSAQGRSHRAWINGRSGEVIGERPVQRARMWASALTPLVIAGLVATGALQAGLLATHKPWTVWVSAFWGALAVIGLLAMFVAGREPKEAPSRHGQFTLVRPAPGKFQQYDPAEIWNGSLQDDLQARAALFQGLGFMLVFVSMFPCLATAGFDGDWMAMLIAYGFSGISAAIFVWAIWASFRQKRKLLGIDR
jgi:hypothetical protein